MTAIKARIPSIEIKAADTLAKDGGMSGYCVLRACKLCRCSNVAISSDSNPIMIIRTAKSRAVISIVVSEFAPLELEEFVAGEAEGDQRNGRPDPGHEVTLVGEPGTIDGEFSRRINCLCPHFGFVSHPAQPSHRVRCEDARVRSSPRVSARLRGSGERFGSSNRGLVDKATRPGVPLRSKTGRDKFRGTR